MFHGVIIHWTCWFSIVMLVHQRVCIYIYMVSRPVNKHGSAHTLAPIINGGQPDLGGAEKYAKNCLPWKEEPTSQTVQPRNVCFDETFDITRIWWHWLWIQDEMSNTFVGAILIDCLRLSSNSRALPHPHHPCRWCHSHLAHCILFMSQKPQLLSAGQFHFQGIPLVASSRRLPFGHQTQEFGSRDHVCL